MAFLVICLLVGFGIYRDHHDYRPINGWERLVLTLIIAALLFSPYQDPPSYHLLRILR